MRGRVLVFAAVLIALLAGVGAGFSTPAAVELPADADADTTFATVEGDLGLATRMGDAHLRVAFERAALEHRYEQADTDERVALLRAHLEELEQHHATLLEREVMALRTAPDDGVGSLMQTYATTFVEARALRESLTALEPLLAEHDGLNVSERADDLSGRLGLHLGPVRSSLGEAASAGGPVHPRISRSESAIAAEAITGNHFVREVTRYDRINASGPDRLGNIVAAVEVVESAYPSLTTTDASRSLGDGWYRVDRSGDGFRVEAIVYGPAEAIAHVREYQRLDQLDDRDVTSTTDDGLTLEVDHGETPGPLGVSVQRSAGDDPVEAAVYLRQGTTWAKIGSTGSDGHTWVVMPDQPFDVRVVAPDGSIATVTVE